MNQKLTKEDKGLLYKKINDVIATTAFIAIGGIVLSSIVYIFLVKANNMKEESAIQVLTIINLIVLVTFYWINGGQITKDLIYGGKDVCAGVIENKEENIKYAWSGDIAVDMAQQAYLMEYFISISGVNYSVTSDIYQRCQVGDTVYLHITQFSKLLIRISF